MPLGPSNHDLRVSIRQLLPEATRAFPHQDPRVLRKDVSTIDGDGVRGRTSVEVLPDSMSWADLSAALRADGVVEVAVDFCGTTRKPGLGRMVTGRHTAPKKLSRMNRAELLAVHRLLDSITP